MEQRWHISKGLKKYSCEDLIRNMLESLFSCYNNTGQRAFSSLVGQDRLHHVLHTHHFTEHEMTDRFTSPEFSLARCVIITSHAPKFNFPASAYQFLGIKAPIYQVGQIFTGEKKGSDEVLRS